MSYVKRHILEPLLNELGHQEPWHILYPTMSDDDEYSYQQWLNNQNDKVNKETNNVRGERNRHVS